MHKLFFLQIINVLLLFGLFSCNEEKNKQNPLTNERIKIIVDSIGHSKTIACFIEEGSFSVLVYENEKNENVLKLIYRTGYPIYTDSLVYIKHHKFKSKHFNTTYLIKDSVVISINYAKIIHPSSNWQGQTPWSQPYVNIYERVNITQ